METVRLPLSEIQPYHRNPRDHSDVDAIAGSLQQFGWRQPLVVDADRVLIVGHGRYFAALKIGMTEAPVHFATDLTPEQVRAYRIVDNQSHTFSEWDFGLLAEELEALEGADYDLDSLGFTAEDLAKIMDAGDESEAAAGIIQDEIPDPPADPIAKRGDLWILGQHRVLCGDSTNAADVARLMGGATANLIHADPPYGMGKEAAGVVNDNLYAAKLDAFQMEWWRAFRQHTADNGSAYIWGNAPDLWRLWYVEGLSKTEKLELRNEIVWDKQSIAGMASDLMTQFPTATERCLFFQFGDQFRGNVNTDAFPESWEPIRAYMEQQATAAAVGPKQIKAACGCGMYAHWFTRSQFTLIPANHYKTLAKQYPEQFRRPWRDLKREWDRVKGGPTSEIQGARSYFDNGHSIMTDVWQFPRVTGEDRHDHATPKPVAMMVRAIKSSCPPNGIVAEPFGGSGSTLIAAEQIGRSCYTMEISPQYVDVICQRWAKLTGKEPVLELDARPVTPAKPAKKQKAT